MGLLFRLLRAVAAFVVVWLVLWLVAEILGHIPVYPTVWLSKVIHLVEVAFAALCAVLVFVQDKRL